ncbi:MAG: HesA/MoeB/ThiF family protein [Actinomycetaceae bacterium]|nr:HesA/MoeB/ThiF family protein [Actinomycetaceae bacterium]
MVSERERLTAQVKGIGEVGIDKLHASSVLVVGAGGIGSPVLAYLTAAGIGHIGIADPDIVELSNLQRQVIHSHNSIGMVKAQSAAQTIHALNPTITVTIEPLVSASNATHLCSSYDVVIDATDNFDTKYLLSDTCQRVGGVHVWGTIVGMSYQVSLFTDDITLRDLYPTPPPHGTTPTSAAEGVLGAVCGQVGSTMATETIKWITGMGTPLLGRLLIVDAAEGRWNIVPFRPHVESATNRTPHNHHSMCDQQSHRDVHPDGVNHSFDEPGGNS